MAVNRAIAEIQYLGGLRHITGWGSDPLFDEETMLQKAEVLDDPWAKYAVSKVRSLCVPLPTARLRRARRVDPASMTDGLEIISMAARDAFTAGRLFNPQSQ
jgi:hypothetical protein